MKVNQKLKIKTGHFPEYLTLIFDEYTESKAELMPVPTEVDVARHQDFKILPEIEALLDQ